MSKTLTPLQELLLSRLPATFPQAHMRHATGIDENHVRKIIRYGVMPSDASAEAISTGLNIRMAVLVEAARESCVGRPLPKWACRHWETPQHWQHYDRAALEMKPLKPPRAISQTRWAKIVAEIKPNACLAISPARVIEAWLGAGATQEQVDWAKQQLGVA